MSDETILVFFSYQILEKNGKKCSQKSDPLRHFRVRNQPIQIGVIKLLHKPLHLAKLVYIFDCANNMGGMLPLIFPRAEQLLAGVQANPDGVKEGRLQLVPTLGGEPHALEIIVGNPAAGPRSGSCRGVHLMR